MQCSHPINHITLYSTVKLSHADCVRFDNKAFSEHERLSNYGIETYFADPYRSIQRARNENTNGLIWHEEHCSVKPKLSLFDNISEAQIQVIKYNLNHRSRKSLGYSTPSDVMAGFLIVDHYFSFSSAFV